MAEDVKTVNDLYNDEPEVSPPDAGTSDPTPAAAAPAPVVDDPPAKPTKEEPPATPAEPDPTSNGEPAPAASDDPPAGDPAKGEPAPEDNRPGVERWLAEYGIEGGMIKFDDGEKVPFDELTPGEQHVVLKSLAKESRPTIEAQNDLNEDEIGFINMAREAGKPIADLIADIANEQLAKIKTAEEAQNLNWDDMSKDAVYLAFLKEKNPDLKDDELQEDLEKAKETKTYETVVEGIRKDFKTKQDLSREADIALRNKSIDEDIEDQRKVIVETVAPLKEVAGFQITDDQKNLLLGDILELNEVGDSLLLENIFSDPNSILEAAWFQKYGKSAISQMESYYKQEVSKAYARGRDETMGKMPESDIPARIGGLGKRVDLNPDDGYGVSPNAKVVDDLYDD